MPANALELEWRRCSAGEQPLGLADHMLPGVLVAGLLRQVPAGHIDGAGCWRAVPVERVLPSNALEGAVLALEAHQPKITSKASGVTA